nr:hypothetical protein [Acinetobacter baumannii]
MNGQLTATLIADEADLTEFAEVVPVLEKSWAITYKWLSNRC